MGKKRRVYRPTLTERIDDAFTAEPPDQLCPMCMGPARGFGYETFPRILDAAFGRMSYEELERLVRATFKDKRSCFLAPKSMVAVCSDKAKAAEYFVQQRKGLPL